MLIALVAGEDALKFESLSDHVIVAKAMAVLRSIFGDTAVPEVSLNGPNKADNKVIIMWCPKALRMVVVPRSAMCQICFTIMSFYSISSAEFNREPFESNRKEICTLFTAEDIHESTMRCSLY